MTVPTQQQIELVVGSIIDAFDGNPALWVSFLNRAKLTTELNKLNSERTNMQAAEDVQNAAYSVELVAKNAAIAAKQAEIDALEG